MKTDRTEANSTARCKKIGPLAIAALSIIAVEAGASKMAMGQIAESELDAPAVRGRAQTYAPAESVSEPRNANALRVGDLLLFPRAAVNAVYDDNIDSEETNEQDDIIISSEAGFRLQSNLRRHAFGAELLAGYDQFVEDGDESDFRWGAQIDGRLDFSRTTRAIAALRYTRDQEESENSAASIFGPDDDAQFHDIQTQIGVEQELRILTWSLLFTGERTEFEDDIAADRDRSEYGVEALAVFDITEKLRLRLNPSASRLNYDRTDQFFGFDKDETRFTALIGLEFDASDRLTTTGSVGYSFETSDDGSDDDSQGIVVEGGLAYRAADNLTANVNLGFNGAQDSDLEDSGNVAITASAGLNYSLGTRTGIELSAERTLNESDIPGANEEISTTLEARLTRDIADTMQLTVGGGLTRDEFDGLDRDDDTVFAEVGYQWAVNDRVSFNLGYRFSQRDSDSVDGDFTRNVALIGLATTF